MKIALRRLAPRRTPAIEQFEGRLLWTGSFPDAAVVAMAYDGAGALHVAYQNGGADAALRYSTRGVDGTWSPAATVDPALPAGSQLAIAVNAAGAPGIAYYDPAAGDLKFASRPGTEWQSALVDFKGDVGRSPALAFDRLDRPLISSYSVTRQDLKLSTFNGRRWRNAVVDAKNDVGRHRSIDVSPVDGSWAIAYEATTAGQAKVRSRRDK